MNTRTRDLAGELRLLVRLAGRDPESLEGALPTLSGFHNVAEMGELDEAARVHLILHRLIPEYVERLPAGRDCRAIRELLTWEDEDGEAHSLTTRYHKAAAHLVNAASDFGRRQEPRLLLECARRFIAFDHADRLGEATRDPLPEAPLAAAPAPPPPAPDPGSGIVAAHRSLDYHLLVDRIAEADEVAILNTWIPELNLLADALVDALARGTRVSILMLYPDSEIARMRSRSLHGSTQARFRENRVQPGVRQCLDVLADIARTVGEEAGRRLRVRLYHSLPSIAVYSVDDRAWVSVFVHGQLAVKSVQLEIQGRDSMMGALAFGELDTLWEIGQEFEDLEQWQSELEHMRRGFEIQL